MNTQTVSLNLSKAKAVGQIARIGQADSEGTTIEAHVYDGATPANLSEATATFCMRLPDGTHFVEDGNCTISGNVVTYVVDEEHCAVVEGYTDEAYFRIDKGGSTYSTARFRVKVFRAASSGASVPESYSSEVEELIDELDDAIETATDAANVANAAAANANATADGVESRVQEMAQDAAETATADAEQRIQDAIDAMGDISELAVPLMSKDIRGGARLEEHGGLVLRDEKLSIGSLVQESDGYARGGLAEVTAKGHAEQDGTPTPESPMEIQVVRGRNLLDIGTSLSDWGRANNNGLTIQSGSITQFATGTIDSMTGTITISTFNYTGYNWACKEVLLEKNTDYYFSCDNNNLKVIGHNTLNVGDVGTELRNGAGTFNSGNYNYYTVVLYPEVSRSPYKNTQLTLGSTPQPYVPYGYVGMEARDPDTDELISYTALPLPQRGWVAGLPDGTADVLRLNGAGKCDWTLLTSIETFDGDESWNNPDTDRVRYKTIALKDSIKKAPRVTNVIEALSTKYVAESAYDTYFKNVGISVDTEGAIVIYDESEDLNAFVAALQSVPMTVLYPLATPVIEECGYINPLSIDGECQISIPELDKLGIKYFVDDSVTEYGRQMYARAYAELGDAITELAARVAALES